MVDVFPFGQDWSQRDRWLGGFNAKSDRWLVSYEGNFSLLCGYHSFIFLGLDSLSIGVVNLTGCGPSIGLPVGKILGFADPRNARAIETMYDRGADIRAADGALDMEVAQAGFDSGRQLWAKMQQGIPQFLNSHIPFSLSDLTGSPGSVAGAEVEAVGTASLYWIEGYDGLIGNKVFGPDGIANSGGGLISASVRGLVGMWTVEKFYNLYYELGTDAQKQCILENSSPAYAKPYRQIPNLHPILQDLPPAFCDVPEALFNPLAAFSE